MLDYRITVTRETKDEHKEAIRVIEFFTLLKEYLDNAYGLPITNNPLDKFTHNYYLENVDEPISLQIPDIELWNSGSARFIIRAPEEAYDIHRIMHSTTTLMQHGNKYIIDIPETPSKESVLALPDIIEKGRNAFH